MREIKFRAWDKNLRSMFSSDLILDSIDLNALLKSTDAKVTKRILLMQYTGLKDKNGKEIYSGDICRMHRFTEVLGENLGVMEGEVETVVQMSIGVMGVMVNKEPLFAYFDEDFHDMSEPFEIIGNIHQHPELLEQS